MEQYLPIVLLLVVGVGFAAGSFVASATLGPKRPTGAKEGPYESGIVSDNPSAARFAVRFYMVAMIFIIFDIEVIFLYPWAVMYHQLGRFGLAEMATFAVVVFVSVAYLVSHGALDWGPGLRVVTRTFSDPSRTLRTTVRRVARPEQLIDGPAPRPVDELSSSPFPPATESPAPEPVSSATSGGGPVLS
jgi:NADH-quinone oxidoreductase subunit A